MQPDSDDDRPRIDDPSEAGDQVSAPGWARAPLRLIVLLGILAVLVAYGLPKIAREVSGAATAPGATTASTCELAPVQAPLKWSLTQADNAVAASGLKSLIGDGTADIQGLEEPSAAWSDAYPVDEHSPDPNSTPAEAGYELRWWTEGHWNHQAADLFVFPTTKNAAQYARQAASARCRKGAASYVISQPAGGRALVWTNPDGYPQADVFFSRANRAYRIVEVSPPGSRLHRAQLIKIPQEPACRLRDAICTADVSRRGGASASPARPPG